MHDHDGGPREEPSAAFTPAYHRLFGQLDRVIRAFGRAPGDLVRELELFDRQVREYFADEEGAFERQAYPRAREHREEHAAYALELERARTEGVGAAGIAFLRAWLVNHAAGSDRLLGEWLGSSARCRGREA